MWWFPPSGVRVAPNPTQPAGERRRPPPRGDGLRKKFALSLDAAPGRNLAAQPQTLDQRAVALDVDVLEVAEEPAALAHEQQKPTTRVVVVLVLLEVLREVLDPLGEDRDLHLGGSGVCGVGGVLVDDRLLDVCIQCHRGIPFLSLRGAPHRLRGLSVSAAVQTATCPA